MDYNKERTARRVPLSDYKLGLFFALQFEPVFIGIIVLELQTSQIDHRDIITVMYLRYMLTLLFFIVVDLPADVPDSEASRSLKTRSLFEDESCVKSVRLLSKLSVHNSDDRVCIVRSEVNGSMCKQERNVPVIIMQLSPAILHTVNNSAAYHYYNAAQVCEFV